MGYKVTFVTKKIFNDGMEKLTIKNGYLPNYDKIRETKRRNKARKRLEYESATQAGQLDFDGLEKRAERLKELDRKYAPRLENAVRAMNRSKNRIMELLKCNDFAFFVTLTFGNKVDRLDDDETRKAFAEWSRKTRKRLPDMTYFAIGEYQRSGALHFHMLVGNVTAEQLKLTDSGKKVRRGRSKGQPIYNVTAWEYGFSTATVIQDKDAVKYYLAKYLTKGKADPRFFGKKRYFTSRNINRPTIEKMQFPCGSEFDIFDSIDKDAYNIDYADDSKEYTVLSRKINEKDYVTL
ncbi:hypothetical protein FACS1894211_14220 [Clostridia bacterium]|nr:hypothetical protein FACS1894211_14220 [Clostridia bacterium]